MAHSLSADPQTAYEELADIALAAGEMALGVIGDRDVLAVPDVIQVEYAAQGLGLPPAPRLRRADGREIAFYLLPRPVGA